MNRCGICCGSKKDQYDKPCICTDGTEQGEMNGLRLLAIKSSERVQELENTLYLIRDKWCPALVRDSTERDKIYLHSHSIQYEIAKVMPKINFPKRG